MIPLFIGLTLANLIGLATAVVLGYAAMATGTPALRQYHLLAGALAAITCIAVHCIVFTYFIATSKWVRHAVLVKKLDEALVKPTRSFKTQAFPAALAAMTVVFFAAILGAITDNYAIPKLWHHLAALMALAVNVAVAFIEYNAIRRNGLLIDEILRQAG